MKPRLKLRLDGSAQRYRDRPHFKLLLDGNREVLWLPWHRATCRRLCRARRARRLTPTRAAALIGVTPARWRDIEAGRTTPTWGELRAMYHGCIDVGAVFDLGSTALDFQLTDDEGRPV